MFRSPNLTESKKRIITLLRNQEEFTKKDLSEKSGLGWATIVKALNELIDERIIVRRGTNSRRTYLKGKNAYVYALNQRQPFILGIDVEHTTTTAILTNIPGSILSQLQWPTPVGEDALRGDFLVDCVKEVLASAGIGAEDLKGIGIGLPGLTFPTTSWAKNLLKAKYIEGKISEIFRVRTRVDTNTNAYTLYARWHNPLFRERDFLFISIRTGIGTSIFSNGDLFRGESSLAGGIGHMKVVPPGAVCHCGGTGCLETAVNQNLLFQKYRRHVLGKSFESVPGFDRQKMVDGLEDLFRLAGKGNPAARSVLEEAGDYIGKAIVNAISILGIEHIMISGYFGSDGAPLIDPIKETVRKALLRSDDIPITYVPVDPLGHTLGAAMLILSEYLASPAP